MVLGQDLSLPVTATAGYEDDIINTQVVADRSATSRAPLCLRI